MPDPAVVHEHDDLYRLYRTEWVIVHTLSEDHPDHDKPPQVTGEQLVRAAREHVEQVYGGRVNESQMDLVLHTDNAGHFWVHVKIRKPNLKGEFIHAALAASYAEKNRWSEYEIVSRNSRRDHELRSFGMKKLT